MDTFLYLLILFLFIAKNVFEIILDGLNARYLRQRSDTIPSEFKDHLNETTFHKMQNYEYEKRRLSMLTTAFAAILTAIFLFTGLFDQFHSWVLNWDLSFSSTGWVMVIIPLVAFQFISIPFDLYHQFKLEKKYGFSTITPGMWLGDFIKSLILTGILSAGLLFPGFALVNNNPDSWWILFFLFYMGFNLFIMYIAPYVLLPLFNKFTPLEDEELKEKILDLMDRAGISVNQVYKMDASKRSKHSNAFFVGMGSSKRIVLYDTLLNSMTQEQILAVLAHEAGHWKKKHILKRLIGTTILSAGLMYITFLLLQFNWMIDIFPVTIDSFYARLFYLGLIYSIVFFFFNPLSNFISRKQEREADRFALELVGDGQPLANALINLGVENLSNLYPHPFYVTFHYSHPPLLERIRNLKENNPSAN